MEIKVSHKSKIIVIDNYPRHSQLKREMADRLEAMEDVRKKTTNVKATVSGWDISSNEMEILKHFFIEKTPELYDWIDTNRIGFSQWWANVYRKGDYTIPHDHIGASIISNIYFFKSKQYHSPLVFDDSRRRIKPVEGRMVLFPSYLTHSVPKHKHNETRITLAGDIDLLS